MKRTLITITGIAVASLMIHSAAVARPAWKPMSQAALINLYSGKTWLWRNGAAYFAPDGQFKAWSRAKSANSIGRGAWETRLEGVMCFTASWQEEGAQPAASDPVETCFEHQVYRGRIAQRREPEGDWYFFKHRLTRKNDEVRKLAKGDRTRI